MKHAVLGAGGVGGLVGAALARAGSEVVMVVRPGTAAAMPARFAVESDVLGTFEAPLRCVEVLEEDVDVLWVTVKHGALAEAVAQAPAERVGGVVVPLLNGLDHLEELRSVYGEDRVAAGTIRVESERLGPGRIRQSGPFIGIDLAGPPALRALLEAVAADVDATGIRSRVADDPRRTLYEKLVMLAPFSLTTTASGQALAGVAGDARWRELMVGCMNEVVAVAASEGIVLEAPVAMLDIAPGSMRSSMQKDAEAGRPLEVDHIAGPILEGGRRAGIATPATEELVAIIRSNHGT